MTCGRFCPADAIRKPRAIAEPHFGQRNRADPPIDAAFTRQCLPGARQFVPAKFRSRAQRFAGERHKSARFAAGPGLATADAGNFWIARRGQSRRTRRYLAHDRQNGRAQHARLRTCGRDRCDLCGRARPDARASERQDRAGCGRRKADAAGRVQEKTATSWPLPSFSPIPGTRPPSPRPKSPNPGRTRRHPRPRQRF